MANTPNPFTKTTPLAVRILREEEFRTACCDYDTRAGDALDFHFSDEFHFGDHVTLPCVSLAHLTGLNEHSIRYEEAERRLQEQQGAHYEIDPGYALLQEIIEQAVAAGFTHLGEMQ